MLSIHIASVCTNTMQALCVGSLQILSRSSAVLSGDESSKITTSECKSQSSTEARGKDDDLHRSMDILYSKGTQYSLFRLKSLKTASDSLQEQWRQNISPIISKCVSLFGSNTRSSWICSHSSTITFLALSSEFSDDRKESTVKQHPQNRRTLFGRIILCFRENYIASRHERFRKRPFSCDHRPGRGRIPAGPIMIECDASS